MIVIETSIINISKIKFKMETFMIFIETSIINISKFFL
jgi:hypothetical protein